MGFLCSGDKLSLGPDHDPTCTKWTKVLGNNVETTFLEDTEDIELISGPDDLGYTRWTKVERNIIETTNTKTLVPKLEQLILNESFRFSSLNIVKTTESRQSQL